MRKYTARERQRIHLKAHRKLGLKKKQDAQDYADFMEQCIDDLTSEGTDEDDARDVCQMIWDDTGGD